MKINLKICDRVIDGLQAYDFYAVGEAFRLPNIPIYSVGASGEHRRLRQFAPTV